MTHLDPLVASQPPPTSEEVRRLYAELLQRREAEDDMKALVAHVLAYLNERRESTERLRKRLRAMQRAEDASAQAAEAEAATAARAAERQRTILERQRVLVTLDKSAQRRRDAYRERIRDLEKQKAELLAQRASPATGVSAQSDSSAVSSSVKHVDPFAAAPSQEVTTTAAAENAAVVARRQSNALSHQRTELWTLKKRYAAVVAEHMRLKDDIALLEAGGAEAEAVFRRLSSDFGIPPLP